LFSFQNYLNESLKLLEKSNPPPPALPVAQAHGGVFGQAHFLGAAGMVDMKPIHIDAKLLTLHPPDIKK
jgi:hypothetical protein